MIEVSEQVFRDVLESRLGEFWERALKVFHNFGPNTAYDVTNVITHAADQGKVEEVIRILEDHYERDLQFQHPEIRGTIEDRLLGVRPTQAMFLRICRDILGLQPGLT